MFVLAEHKWTWWLKTSGALHSRSISIEGKYGGTCHLISGQDSRERWWWIWLNSTSAGDTLPEVKKSICSSPLFGATFEMTNQFWLNEKVLQLNASLKLKHWLSWPGVCISLVSAAEPTTSAGFQRVTLILMLQAPTLSINQWTGSDWDSWAASVSLKGGIDC